MAATEVGLLTRKLRGGTVEAMRIRGGANRDYVFARCVVCGLEKALIRREAVEHGFFSCTRHGPRPKLPPGDKRKPDYDSRMRVGGVFYGFEFESGSGTQP